jgi:acyl-CoA thioesterase FadM
MTIPVAAPVVTRTELRPRYEGANIGTWIGFKHLDYLVEEAVLAHLRERGLGPATLHDSHGLCVELVGMDTRILRAVRIDDVVDAEVTQLGDDTGTLDLAVVLRVGPVRSVRARVRVALRHDPGGVDAEPVPPELLRYTVPDLADVAPAHTPPAGDNTFTRTSRIPYYHCHFTKRLQLSGYLRLMEETIDLFLADRGVSVGTLLAEQGWIPAVPHSAVTVLAEAEMEEELHTVFTVEEVYKRLTFTGRMDWHVIRDGVPLPVGTGRITHGYARIGGRAEWGLVSFDDRLVRALGTP